MKFFSIPPSEQDLDRAETVVMGALIEYLAAEFVLVKTPKDNTPIPDIAAAPPVVAAKLPPITSLAQLPIKGLIQHSLAGVITTMLEWDVFIPEPTEDADYYAWGMLSPRSTYPPGVRLQDLHLQLRCLLATKTIRHYQQQINQTSKELGFTRNQRIMVWELAPALWLQPFISTIWRKILLNPKRWSDIGQPKS